jgi:uncharacterized protein (DUF2141 family)
MATCLPASVLAADLVVNVAGIEPTSGQVGCSLFSDAKGFPMEGTVARTLWMPADRQPMTCRFPGVATGTYAVAVVHDLNRNGKVDTNLFGIPTEPWGVSNGVRPTLRAPRFDEAAVGLAFETSGLVARDAAAPGQELRDHQGHEADDLASGQGGGQPVMRGRRWLR